MFHFPRRVRTISPVTPAGAALLVPSSCPSCGSQVDHLAFTEFGVCPDCGFHLRIPARIRIHQLVDPDTFREDDADLMGTDPLRFADTHLYSDRLESAQELTSLTEAVITGRARLEGRPVSLAVFDFRFLGGTMGVAVGEKVVRLFERATQRREAVIVVAASGGVRVQEGTAGLTQMARVAAAMERHHVAGLLSIAVLADPTTGGVFVSPAATADVVLAEPGAYAAFAGSRVSGEGESIDATWLQTHGMVDAVVARPKLRQALCDLVELLTRENRALSRPIRQIVEPAADAARPEGWDAVQLARRPDRPGAASYIARIAERFFELRGDRLYGDDESIIGGIGLFQGQSVVFLGEDRFRPETGPLPAGRQYPEGFRKVVRLALLAAKFRLPIVTLIDTPGAQADASTEARGLARAIGQCLRVFSALPVPVVAALVGEGCSGAAICLAVADRVLMQEHAIFESISPEGAAAILYRDQERAPEMAARMHLTASEARALGVVDEIVCEPAGGAHVDPDLAALFLMEALRAALAESQRWLPDRLVKQRYQRLRSMGTRFISRRRPEAPEAASWELVPKTS